MDGVLTDHIVLSEIRVVNFRIWYHRINGKGVVISVWGWWTTSAHPNPSANTKLLAARGEAFRRLAKFE